MTEPTALDQHPSVSPVETEVGPGYNLMRNRELHDFSGMAVTATENMPWGPMPSKIEVTKPDGSKVEVGANTLLYKFVRAGKELTVSVGAAEHVNRLHIQATEPGSRFDEPSLDALMVDMAEKIPAEVATDPETSAFSIDMGKHMGNEGFASLSELKSEGILAESDIATTETVKEEVVSLNRSGDMESKTAFINEFKTSHPECKVQFQLIRGSVLVPVVNTPKRPTTRLFVVFGKTPAGKTLFTAAPGRYMPAHPDPKQHSKAEGLNEASFRESAEAWFENPMLVG